MPSEQGDKHINDSLSEELYEKACSAIDSLSDELHALSNKLWSNPELKFEEHFAHDLLTKFFEKHGFEIRRKYPLETAFVASNKAAQQGKGPCVAILCEYDALPKIGHACGHNLIAEVGAAAAIGIKAVLDSTTKDLGHLIVMGTPGEESGGGKILMLDAGCFDKVDFCMMAHPTTFNAVYANCLANQKVFVTFQGQAAHAAAFPWEGVNALDAAVQSYNAVSMLRQQMKPEWRAHGVLTEGGVEPAIIPEKAGLHYFFRAPTLKDLTVLTKKADSCFQGAAEATGCCVNINWYGFGKNQTPYLNVINNPVLCDVYEKHAQSLGAKFPPTSVQKSMCLGSTDMGNVTHYKPAIQTSFKIPTDAGNHTPEFTVAAGSADAQLPTLIAAKSMAMTAIEVLCKPELFEQMKKTFTKQE